MSSVSSRKEALEKELIGEDIALKMNVESGRDVSGTRQWQKEATNKQIEFQSKQGVRRRHPQSVLNQFVGIEQTNFDPRYKWEQAIEYENKRVLIPSEYLGMREMDKAVTQIGLVRTSELNYKQSEPKLSALHLIGV